MKSCYLQLALVLCLTVLASAQPSDPARALAAEKIFAALDADNSALLKGQSADHVYEVLRAGRSYPKKPDFIGRVTIPFSDQLGRETNLFLQIPEKPRGVLILLHGLGADSSQLTNGLFADLAKEKGLIVLAPSAQKEPEGKENLDLPLLNKLQPHWWSYRADAFVMTALRDLARKVEFDRNRVLLCGYSMGGFGAWNLGLRFADRFAAAAPIAGGISRREYIGSSKHRLHHYLLDNAVHLPLFFVHGSEDEMVPVRFDRFLHEGLEERKIEHIYVEVKGAGHLLDFRPKSALMVGLDEWFQAQLRDPHPRRVAHTIIDPEPSRSFWLRIDEKWASRGRVLAEVLEDNKIYLKTSGVGRLTLFIDEAIVDAEKSLKVVVNGKVVFEGVLEPSLDAVVDSWQGYEDPAFVSRRRLMIDVP